MDANDDGTTSLSKSSVSAPVVYVRDRRLCTGVLVPSGTAEDAIPAAAPTPAPLPNLRSHSQAGAPSHPPGLNHCTIDLYPSPHQHQTKKRTPQHRKLKQN